MWLHLLLQPITGARICCCQLRQELLGRWAQASTARIRRFMDTEVVQFVMSFQLHWPQNNRPCHCHDTMCPACHTTSLHNDLGAYLPPSAARTTNARLHVFGLPWQLGLQGTRGHTSSAIGHAAAS